MDALSYLNGYQVDDLVAATRDILEVETVRRPRAENERFGRLAPASITIEMQGRLLVPSEQAYDLLAERFRALGHIPILRKGRDGVIVLAMPGETPKMPSRYPLAIGLFVATLASVLWVGSTAAGGSIISGIPFAASLMAILLAHELGHYFVARRLHVPVSPPYFIPFPLSPFGTMGAVVTMSAPPRNRRHLFAVAVAGPLAGLVVTLPLLIVGLMLSPVQPSPVGVPVIQEGNSLFYAALKFLMFGRWLPSGGEDVFLHPMAFAGWAGLFLTGLNLLPAGQLDGGHIAFTLLGGRARYASTLVVILLLGLSIVWQGWLLLALLAFVLGRVFATPFDDVTPITRGERALAIVMLVIFVLIFTPVPLEIKGL